MAKTVTVAVVGYAGCSAWITAGLLELFAIANNARATLPDRSAATVRFDCHIVSGSGRAVRGSHGVTFAARALRRRSDVAVRAGGPWPGAPAAPPLRRCDRSADLVRVARGSGAAGSATARRERVPRAGGAPLEDLRELVQRCGAARSGRLAERQARDDVLVAGELVSPGVPGRRDGPRSAGHA
jgi:hypothetical protein